MSNGIIKTSEFRNLCIALMLYKFVLLAFIISSYNDCACQRFFFITKQVALKECIQRELDNGSSVYTDSAEHEYISDDNILCESTRFLRNHVDFIPRLVIDYYFSSPDSIVRSMFFEIDSLNNKTDRQYSNLTTQYLNQLYDSIRGEIITFAKLPETSQPLMKKVQFGSEYLDRVDHWETSAFSANLYMLTHETNNVFRIRAEINFKKSD